MEKKSQKEVATFDAYMKSHADKVVRSLQWEKESRPKDRKSYEERVVGVINEVDEALHQTLKRAYGAFDQDADEVEELRPDIPIPHAPLFPLKIVRDRTLVEDDRATPQDGET